LSQAPAEYAPQLASERAQLLKEADFAFRQAIALCPYSPEAVFRYANLLVSQKRLDDARLVAETGLKFQPDNASIKGLVENLRQIPSK
jgi:hypothetical protein